MSYRRTGDETGPGGATAVWVVAGTAAFALSLVALWPPADNLAGVFAAGLAYVVMLALIGARHLDRRRWRAGEARTRLAEERLAGFTEASSEWLWETDAEHRFTWLSPRFEEISGMPAAAIIGRTRAEMARHIDGDEAMSRHVADLAAGRPFRDFVYAYRGADGQVRYFQSSGTPVRDAAGRFAGYRGTGREITAIKRAEERLLDALEGMNDGFILWDAEDRVVLVNRAFLRMDEESFAALKPGTRFEDVMRERVMAGKIPAAIGREEEYIRERLVQHRNPSGVPIVQRLASGQWVRIVERRTRDGGIVAIRSDITDLQRQQSETLHAKEQAEEASRAKSRFLATMSHELRTPLNAIIGFSEVMTTGAFGPLGSPKYAEYAAAINASGRHLLNVIGDILDMSRIEAGRYTLHSAPLDVAEIVREAMFIIQVQAEESGLALVNEVEPGEVRLNADRLALKQILINLLSNAIKFTDRGGRIEIAAATTSGGGVELSVRDTGIGIAPELLPHLFDPFSPPSDAALARNSGGTGLGLSICKRLIELHGGSIRVASTPGHGTTVTIAVPAERNLALSPPPAAAARS